MQINGYRPDNQMFRQREKKKKHRALLLSIVLFMILVSAVLLLLWTHQRSENDLLYKQAENVFLNHIYVNNVDLSGMTYQDAFTAVSNRWQETQSGWQLKIVCDGFTYTTITAQDVGLGVDYGEIDRLLKTAWSYGHDGNVNNYLDAVKKLEDEPLYLFTTGGQGNTSQLDYILGVVQQHAEHDPVNASIRVFDPNLSASSPFIYVSDRKGQRIDTAAAKEKIMEMALSGEGGVYDIPVTYYDAELTLSEIQNETALIATGTTAIEKSSSEDRNQNIAVAFSKINGTVVKNGGTFSFNSTVGRRNMENGFVVGLGYVSGVLTEVLGGGVCQCSTTVYSAALCAGMKILKRTPHSIPVSYISLGQDATVNDMRGHEIDFSFRNDSGYPIYITSGIERTASGRLQCVVRFFGYREASNVRYRLRSEIVEVLQIPETVSMIQDTDGKYVTYTDESYCYYEGAEGQVVKTYRQRLVNGEVVQETLVSTDTYKPRQAVYYVGVTERDALRDLL